MNEWLIWCFSQSLSALPIGTGGAKRGLETPPCALLAVSEMRLVGTKAPVLFVEEMFVTDHHRGHGLARCLMVEAAKNMPRDAVVGLVVRSDANQQEGARNVYRSKFAMRQTTLPEMERLGSDGRYEPFEPNLTLKSDPGFKNTPSDKQRLTYFMSAAVGNMLDSLRSHDCASISHDGPLSSGEFLSNPAYSDLVKDAVAFHHSVEHDMHGDTEDAVEIISNADRVYVGYHHV